MEPGIRGVLEVKVDETNIAGAVGSGSIDVFATPQMILLIENTCWRSVADQLPDGQTTVGTHLDVAHLAATPVGMTVRCETELVEVDRRRLVFKAEVFDDKEKVGEGTHERFIIDTDRFMARLAVKRGE